MKGAELLLKKYSTFLQSTVGISVVVNFYSVEKKQARSERNGIKMMKQYKRDLSKQLPPIYEMAEGTIIGQQGRPKAKNKNESLEQLGLRNGMVTNCNNGQRIYGPPLDWEGTPPPQGTEVFVGRLARHVREWRLIDVFSRVGKLYKIRLMVNFSGRNRGFCFVQYASSESADLAVQCFHNYEIIRGCYIAVKKSVDNRRLVMFNVPVSKTRDKILEEVKARTDGVSNITACAASGTDVNNCGFAIVEYECHRSAAIARRKFIHDSFKIGKQTVEMDWAEPLPNGVRTLCVYNMKPMSAKALRREFNRVSSNGVQKVRKMGKLAFIDFVSAELADHARIAMDSTKIDGTIIHITWAKYTPKTSSAKTNGTLNNNVELVADANITNHCPVHNAPAFYSHPAIFPTMYPGGSQTVETYGGPIPVSIFSPAATSLSPPFYPITMEQYSPPPCCGYYY